MTKSKWFLPVIFILSAMVILLLRLILKFNINIIDGFGGALLGVGIGLLLFAIVRRQNK